MKLSALRSRISETGFTLIELLVVIAVMGVLATIVLVAVDPGEQFARANDGNRKQTVNSLGNSVIQYYTVKQVMPTPASWLTDIVTAGELRQSPPASGTTCTGNAVNGYCYGTNASNDEFATVYTSLASKAEDNNSAGTACTTTTDVAFFVFDTYTGKTCKICGAAALAPTPGTTLGNSACP